MDRWRPPNIQINILIPQSVYNPYVERMVTEHTAAGIDDLHSTCLNPLLHRGRTLPFQDTPIIKLRLLTFGRLHTETWATQSLT